MQAWECVRGAERAPAVAPRAVECGCCGRSKARARPEPVASLLRSGTAQLHELGSVGEGGFVPIACNIMSVQRNETNKGFLAGQSEV